MDLNNFIHINRPDFCANVQRYVPPLSEETVIEEEISQDATDKWLYTLADMETEIQPNTTNSKEISQLKMKLRSTTNSVNKINECKDKNHDNSEHKLKEKTIDSITFTVEATSFDQANLKSYICKICLKPFESNNRLTWHMRMHDKNRKRFVCPVQICGRIYASKQACDLHYKQSHLDEGFICLLCHKIFSAKQTLEVHMRYHTKEFPYQCNLCERKFAQKGHLTQHIEVKHQNIRYICTEPDCGKIFQNSVSLRNHAYTHSSMPFKCNRCDKEYPQKNK
ncbi:Zinc finger protein 28 [Lucilia cuprina]|nr:Zinc finger protein 28 [Lucilia cuprina]